MYEIRFYYKNEDKNFNSTIAYHVYERYSTFEKAYENLIELIELYTEIGVDEVVFMPGIPIKILEAYVLFLNKKGKDLTTIVENSKRKD
ncbi:hypothetical protein [Clostridium gasigenes]|uniref:PX domain-containing protein n=1 Tax=Clostridium gasigenes TaxID=94869 RepID=A0A1H0N4H5_9CLOT|nr:hypothetical protein [Clostridium gasigenes]SDO87587.1 hypothetical protein SAMN04488529_101686 [Clostridium gasigenes]